MAQNRIQYTANADYFGPEDEHETFADAAATAATHDDVVELWNTWIFPSYFGRPLFAVRPEHVTAQRSRIDLLVVKVYLGGVRKWVAVLEAKPASLALSETSWDTVYSELFGYCNENSTRLPGKVYAIGAIGHRCKVWVYSGGTYTGPKMDEVTVPGEMRLRPGAQTGDAMDVLTDGFWIEAKLMAIRDWAVNSLA